MNVDDRTVEEENVSCALSGDADWDLDTDRG